MKKAEEVKKGIFGEVLYRRGRIGSTCGRMALYSTALAIFNPAFSMVEVGILKYVELFLANAAVQLRLLLRASVLHPLFFLSCAITPRLPASPSPSSKWDVRGSSVGKIPGECCKARHPRCNNLKSTRQVCWSNHVRSRLGLK